MSRFVGNPQGVIPAPGDGTKKNPGGKISENRGKGGAVTGGINPFTATYDSRPQPGDNRKGATRYK